MVEWSHQNMHWNKAAWICLRTGGPTSESYGTLDLSIQYWTSRGWAFIDVNYGGSTGYGREYRERLLGNWGIVDVNDCCGCARFLPEGRWGTTLYNREISKGLHYTCCSCFQSNI
ncbi:hypothetical protein AMTRI_Chr04g246960 [Amborella trichopoda]